MPRICLACGPTKAFGTAVRPIVHSWMDSPSAASPGLSTARGRRATGSCRAGSQKSAAAAGNARRQTSRARRMGTSLRRGCCGAQFPLRCTRSQAFPSPLHAHQRLRALQGGHRPVVQPPRWGRCARRAASPRPWARPPWVERVRVELFGSLGFTGRGHGSHLAVTLGLLGEARRAPTPTPPPASSPRWRRPAA